MQFYKITARIVDNKNIPNPREREEYQDYASSFAGMNEMFYQKSRKQYYLFVTRVTPKNIIIGAILKGDKNIEDVLKKYLELVVLRLLIPKLKRLQLKP